MNLDKFHVSNILFDVCMSSRAAANVLQLLAVGLSKHQLCLTTNVYLKIPKFFSRRKYKFRVSDLINSARR